MKKTLLLVTIHGFKGSDNTFEKFPNDLRALLSHALPKIDVVIAQYPQFETRGDLRECVARFKEWLQNKVIDLEVANKAASPTVDPSVQVILIGHSMGGLVAAETLLSIVRDEPVPASAGNYPPSNQTSRSHTPTNETTTVDDADSSTPPPSEMSRLFFPRIQAILAFDTPFLGISPGVLAHGAEEQFNNASTAYKAFNNANKIFGGWGSPRSASPAPAADAAAQGLPAAAESGSGWGKWGKYAMYGGAVAAVAGAAGAAYMNRNQISAGFAWAGSHLEFVGCLARGAELQKRVESVVALTKSHDVGFANFYGALGESAAGKTKYAGAVVGEDRTFCVIPKPQKKGLSTSPVGSKREAASSGNEHPRPKRRKTQTEDDMAKEAQESSKKVKAFADDTSKNKGLWVKCVNETAGDEIKAHTSIFTPSKNPGYYAMSHKARDQIVAWLDKEWYESSGADGKPQKNMQEEMTSEDVSEEMESTEEQATS
ncbi:hypothetical protein K431DRAFT_272103 [Polychaeton citri CBS 116435]|uniref:DUF676 domain-containing protein n=1 Tax=Polychaeton citri CBS 116435 TaxID=1314669 RepID=A0A9P4Q4S9_9PEZI|nr:hypothetical protein K431DRAFT_272103 [Polychaeton citri CBS 116435]